MVSAFHGGAELVAHLKKSRRRRRSQQQFEEQQLQDSLETGENTVGQRYSTDLKELGEIVRVGDGRCCILSPPSQPNSVTSNRKLTM